MVFQELNNDQRREVINSQQRFQALTGRKGGLQCSSGFPDLGGVERPPVPHPELLQQLRRPEAGLSGRAFPRN